MDRRANAVLAAPWWRVEKEKVESSEAKENLKLSDAEKRVWEASFLILR